MSSDTKSVPVDPALPPAVDDTTTASATAAAASTAPPAAPAAVDVPTGTPAATAAPPAAAAAPIDTKAVDAAAAVPKGAADAVDDVTNQFANTTVFGGKSLDELHKIQDRDSHLSAGKLFTDPSLRIPPPILDALTVHMRFERPSLIQATTLPLILDNKNVIAQAQSGAGKTIAFVIGMLARVNLKYSVPQALCMSPVRELVNQIISDAVMPLSVNLPGLRVEAAVPGNSPTQPTCPSHIVVGTPGTMKRWVEDGYVRMESVSIFVVDEADHMVREKALAKDTLEIRRKLDPRAQILMFSATYEKSIIELARKINPRAYVITPRTTEELVLDVIFQVKINVSRVAGGKLQVLKDIYDYMAMQQSIVFVERRDGANAVAKFMRDSGLTVSVLHSELTGPERDQVMAEFRRGKSKVLITTNVLARGVDVPAVAVVVNFDLPTRRNGQVTEADPATYLHRIGRSGRFGRKGTAISFVESSADEKILAAIEQHYFPSGQSMVTEWDANDIDGLTRAVDDLPSTDAILPSALDGSDKTASVSVSILN